MDVNVPLQHSPITGYPTLRRMENFLCPGAAQRPSPPFFSCPRSETVGQKRGIGLLSQQDCGLDLGEQTRGEASNALISLT